MSRGRCNIFTPVLPHFAFVFALQRITMSRQLFKIFLHRVSLRAILATREGSIFELNITFRKPRKRKTTFPRTPGVAERVINISSIRTSLVASPGLRATLATREGSIFELDIKFRKPRKRKTTFPRTPVVAQRVIDTFVICTLFRAKASARIASSCRVPLRAVG